MAALRRFEATNWGSLKIRVNVCVCIDGLVTKISRIASQPSSEHPPTLSAH